MKDYFLHQLPNGIRVVHKQVSNTKIAHCGFILDIGSRDEAPGQEGIAHFWEHMAFKGTHKRKAFHIINRLEAVGGELNAYTTKEKICFYASVLDGHFDKALELLTDITFDSIFPEKQIEKERNVILEEMAMYYDVPEDAIQDDFDTLLFPDHPLGVNILGTPQSVRSFKRADFTAFVQQHLNTERVIFSSVSAMPFEAVLKLAQRHLAHIPASHAPARQQPLPTYHPSVKQVQRSLTQSQCAVGSTAYALDHPQRLAFFMLINILGGPGLNSRLNMSLRERYGFVYSVDANYTPYVDTGQWAVFFGTDPKQLGRAYKLVLKELQKLCAVPLGTLQLHRAKEQLMGQLAMGEENNVSLMLMMGKSLLDLDRIDPLDSIFNEIKAITALDLQDVACQMFNPEGLSRLVFVPNE